MKIKNIIAMGTTLLALAGNTKAQVKGFLKVPYNFKDKSVLVEPNAFYNLPGNIKGYTFMQLRSDNKYFGKTMLKKKITSYKGVNINAKVALKHANELFTAGNAGVSIDGKISENITASTSYLPITIDKNGQRQDGIFDFYIGAKLPAKFKIEAFGLINSRTGNWNYGEAKVGTEITKGIHVNYNPILRGNGSPIPGLEHRIGVDIDF